MPFEDFYDGIGLGVSLALSEAAKDLSRPLALVLEPVGQRVSVSNPKVGKR